MDKAIAKIIFERRNPQGKYVAFIIASFSATCKIIDVIEKAWLSLLCKPCNSGFCGSEQVTNKENYLKLLIMLPILIEEFS